MHQIRFLASVRLFVCLCLRWRFVVTRDRVWESSAQTRTPADLYRPDPRVQRTPRHVPKFAGVFFNPGDENGERRTERLSGSEGELKASPSPPPASASSKSSFILVSESPAWQFSSFGFHSPGRRHVPSLGARLCPMISLNAVRRLMQPFSAGRRRVRPIYFNQGRTLKESPFVRPPCSLSVGDRQSHRSKRHGS